MHLCNKQSVRRHGSVCECIGLTTFLENGQKQFTSTGFLSFSKRRRTAPAGMTKRLHSFSFVHSPLSLLVYVVV